MSVQTTVPVPPYESVMRGVVYSSKEHKLFANLRLFRTGEAWDTPLDSMDWQAHETIAACLELWWPHLVSYDIEETLNKTIMPGMKNEMPQVPGLTGCELVEYRK